MVWRGIVIEILFQDFMNLLYFVDIFVLSSRKGGLTFEYLC